MSSTDGATPTHSISDPYSHFGIIKNPDGSFTRIPEFVPTTPASSDPTNPIPVSTKDIPINQHNNTWARLYLPRPPPAAKLPLIVFYHGGGFVIASAASSFFQNFCNKIVLQIPALMVSIEYRLAPEHRLPAAYDDCLEALHWLRTTADEWLTDHADFSKCFILGNSGGGNIVYHVSLRVASSVDRLMPLQIRGLILHQPFFGGVNRTSSEIRSVNDKVVPLGTADIIWGLALPDGVDRDHEYCNPTARDIEEEVVDKIKGAGWKFLVTGYEGDPFVDRQREVVKLLKDKGIDVIEHFGGGGCHGIEFYDDSYTDIFVNVLKNFLLTC
ncbi:hypothetical protein ACS0TY_025044 [Phlomoides rotata]